jgi:hypothetical protein
MVWPQNNLSADQLTPPTAFPEIISIETVPFLLEQKRKELSQAHKDVLVFLDEVHTAEDTKEWEKQIRQYESALVSVREVLDANTDRVPEKLFKSHDHLIQEVRTITGDLREDRKSLEQKNKESEFDLLKFYSYVIVIPSIAYTHFKSRFPENSSVADTIYTAVMVSGAAFHLRSNIRSAWKAAVKDITPRDIKNSISFTAYYAKNGVLEKAQATKAGASRVIKKLGDSAKSMNPIRRRLGKSKKVENKNELS